MLRKIALVLVCLSLLTVGFVARAADPSSPGCYVDAPTAVDEGTTFTATVKCHNVTDNVFGFEFGTTLTGQATTSATTYTPGDFVSGATNGTLQAVNTLAQYAVSRQGNETATGDFTLGSFSLTADKGLTSDGSATVALPAASFKLSDNSGAALSWLQSSPDATVTITNITLALLSGNVTVRSDGSVTSLKNVALNVGGTDYTAATVSGGTKALAVTGEYTNLTLPVSVSMDSHLACTKNYSLTDGSDDAAAKIGTITLKAGDVVSVSGDTDINIQDATAIGAQFGTSSPTGQVDVNKDGKVDIYDLVHVGRNYGATQGSC
jgi:hypothetical protein